MVRVRSASEDDEEKIWSEWSPVTVWKSTVGLEPESGKHTKFLESSLFMFISF